MVVNRHVQPQALIFFDDDDLLFVLAERTNKFFRTKLCFCKNNKRRIITTNRMGPAWAFL
jgi:hypothetical protein